jgi:DNA-binding Lrp family transcriptional regulator
MTDSSVMRKVREHLSGIDIVKILALDKVSIPQREIASLVKCSRKAVQNALANYLFETFSGRKPRREYQRKTTNREDRYIERALKQNNSLPLRDITNIIGLPISERTVRRRRSEVGLKSYIAAEKPGLRDENVAKRLEWAMRYKDWTVED